jgi:hypothetical protein
VKKALSSPKTASIRTSVYRYQNILMVSGLILSFSGGSWDITFHILSQPESFFSLPHSLVYSGILLVISIFLINFRKNFSEAKPIKRNNILILAGIVLILTAGPFDFSWHLKFGLDGLLSPPHLTLLTGWLLIAIGNLKITNIRINGTKKKKGETDNSGKIINSGEFKSISQGKVPHDKKSIKIQNKVDWDDKIINGGGAQLYQLQLFLNLSILLMIISGFLYFFSLPFSETQSYNFNPPPDLAILVYGIGFPILFSSYFLYILCSYTELKTMVPLVGTFYVIITLITQISSNSYLSGYIGYYLLNLIPFLLYYLANLRYSFKIVSSKTETQNLDFKKKNTIPNLTSRYAVLGIIFALLSYSLCFPLNTYIYNEEIYGYLIYQYVVVYVYQMIFSENFMIILPMSALAGYIGFIISQTSHLHFRNKV